MRTVRSALLLACALLLVAPSISTASQASDAKFLAEPAAGSSTEPRGSYFVVVASPGGEFTQSVALRNDSAGPLDLKLAAVDAGTAQRGGTSFGLESETPSPGWRLGRPGADRGDPRRGDASRAGRLQGHGPGRRHQRRAPGRHLRPLAHAGCRRRRHRSPGRRLHHRPEPAGDRGAGRPARARGTGARHHRRGARRPPRRPLPGGGGRQPGPRPHQGRGRAGPGGENFTKPQHRDLVPGTSIAYPVKWADSVPDGERHAHVEIRYGDRVAVWDGKFRVGEELRDELANRQVDPPPPPVERRVPVLPVLGGVVVAVVLLGGGILLGRRWKRRTARSQRRRARSGRPRVADLRRGPHPRPLGGGGPRRPSRVRGRGSGPGRPREARARSRHWRPRR